MTPAWIAAFCALWVLVLLLAFLVLGTLRRVTAAFEGVSGAEVSAFGAAPTTLVESFELYDDAGLRITSEELLAEPSTILLFIKPDCGPCLSLLEHLDGIDERIGEVPFHVVAPESPRARTLALSRERPFLYERDGSASRAFSNRATPQAYAVGNNHMVLDRRVPASLEDLLVMAKFQREGGGEAMREHVSAA